MNVGVVSGHLSAGFKQNIKTHLFDRILVKNDFLDKAKKDEIFKNDGV